jgi:hypothetical protein
VCDINRCDGSVCTGMEMVTALTFTANSNFLGLKK